MNGSNDGQRRPAGPGAGPGGPHPNTLSSFHPQAQGTASSSVAAGAAAAAPNGNSTGQHVPAPAMPVYLGGTVGGATAPSANSPFQRLNAQVNGTASNSPYPLLPHLQWSASRPPAGAPPAGVVAAAGARPANSILAPADSGRAPPRPVQQPTQSTRNSLPAPVKRDPGTQNQSAEARPSLPASSSATTSNGAAASANPRPRSLPDSVTPIYKATAELDPHYPDTPLIKTVIPLTGLHIVTSRRQHYKISRFHPFHFSGSDQSDGFWQPKNLVSDDLVREWRAGREQRLQFKNSVFPGDEEQVQERAQTREPERKEQQGQDLRQGQEVADTTVSAAAQKRKDGSPSSAHIGQHAEERANKRQKRSTPEESTSQDVNGQPSEQQVVPGSGSEEAKPKPRGRPKGSKNKLPRKPVGGLLHAGPQEIDEEDELIDEEIVVVPAPPKLTKKQQEELDQEQLVTRMIQAKAQPIVNTVQRQAEPILEIVTNKPLRFTTSSQKEPDAAEFPGDAEVTTSLAQAADPSSSLAPAVPEATDSASAAVPEPAGPRSRRLGKQKAVSGDDSVTESTDSQTDAPASSTRGRGAAKLNKRNKGGPASRVRAVTEAEFKGLLGARTGSSLEPSPPPNGRALRSTRGGQEDVEENQAPKERERERDASSPVEEFLSQPQAIISADELARRAIPRVGGWIVPVAPPRTVTQGVQGSRNLNVLQTASTPPSQAANEPGRNKGVGNFAVVVPVRPDPPQGEFGREEQLLGAYTQLRDRHPDSGPIRTPQDLTRALQNNGLLQPQQQQVSAPIVPARPTIAAAAVVPSQTRVPSAPVQQNPPAAASRPSAANGQKPMAVADLLGRLLNSHAVPAFLRFELTKLCQSLQLTHEPGKTGFYRVMVDLAQIPILASKECWWFDLDLGKVQEGGTGYTVIIDFEVKERTVTTYGMHRAMVRQLHTMPTISPWYDAQGRRLTNDGSLAPDDERTEHGAQTEPLQDAQSLAVAQYQAEIVALRKELAASKAELQAESVAKHEVEEQSAFRQRQYDQASTRAVELSREVSALETQVATLKRQLSDGLAAHRHFANIASERYQQELQEVRTEIKLLRAQANNTDNEVRKRAAEYDTLLALEVARTKEREKNGRLPTAAVVSVPVVAAAPAGKGATMLPPATPLRINAAASSAGPSNAVVQQASARAALPSHSLTPPSMAISAAGPSRHSTLAPGLEAAGNLGLGVGEEDMSLTQGSGDVVMSSEFIGLGDIGAPATQATHFL
ncbi:hypothetical protein V8E36_002420 [Tilletia maclaganii]